MLKAPSIFPPQKLPKGKKDDEWKQSCLKYIVAMYRSWNKSRREMSICMDLYNGVYDEKDLEYVTNPYRVNEGFPAKPQAMNIIKSRIDVLVGEEAAKPMILKVSRTSQDASSSAQDAKKKMLEQYVYASIESGMGPDEQKKFQQQIESGQIMPPESIQKYMEYDYKDMAETTAYHSLNFLKEKLNTNHQFLKGWANALKTGCEVYYNGIINGEPFMESVDPRDFAFDMSPEIEFIEDGWWACRHMRMSYTDVHDRLYEYLTEKQLDELLGLAFGGAAQASMKGAGSIDAYWNFIDLQSGNTGGIYANTGILDVYHGTWRSFKKIGFVTYKDESGSVVQDIVTEDYVKTGNEISIEWQWVCEVWEGYEIGNGSTQDMFVAIQPVEYQHTSIDNPNSAKLPYSGGVYNNTSNGPKSLVSTMKPLQYMYIILWYRFELALARDKGKILNMDLTQVPKSLGITTQQWLHYISSLGINFFNPYETGWDIPGREGGRAASFNQFSAQDLTSSSEIATYVKMMDKIEDMLGDLSGVSRQRLGQIQTSESVTNVQSSVRNSTSVTEPLIWMHSQIKKNSMKMLLDSAKEAWRRSGKQKLNYILDDGTRAFIDISESFLYEDFDLFIIDSTQELDKINQIKGLSQYALSSGASLLDVVEIMTNDNLMMLKKKLKEISDNKAKLEQQQQQAEQQIEQQKTAVEQQKVQSEAQIAQSKLEIEKYKIDTDNQTKIAIEQMRSYADKMITDMDNNGIPDPVDIGNLQLKQLAHEASVRDKETAAELKNKEIQSREKVELEKNKSKEKIENKKAELAREQIKSNEKIENQKAENAIKIEQLKSRTALKNKVPGEGR